LIERYFNGIDEFREGFTVSVGFRLEQDIKASGKRREIIICA
jgi:hypothetical protein